MKAQVGDTIKWNFHGKRYAAEVAAIIDGEYAVYVEYDDHGLTQDIIAPDEVIEIAK